jgi:hypothetical protein
MHFMSPQIQEDVALQGITRGALIQIVAPQHGDVLLTWAQRS